MENVVKIYTRTGDEGKTSLFGGRRVSKADLRVEAYGTVDELNSVIGIVVSEYQRVNIKKQEYIAKIKNELMKIQRDLFEIGATLANPKSQAHNSNYLQKRVGEFEKFIDEMTEELPELRNFILSGGGKTGALLQFARTVCRRAERQIVALSKHEEVNESVLMYFNRLSDLFFTMARFVNHKEGRKEIVWKRIDY